MKLRIFALVAGAALLAACSSSSSGGSANPTPSASVSVSASGNAPADPTAAKAAITTAWEKFFSYATPRAEAKTYIEDGNSLNGALDFAAQLQKAQKFKQGAQVTDIAFNSPTDATVTFKLLNGTSVVLPNATGHAVLVNGKWLVSKVTFCTLIELGASGKTVPGCS